jgi:GNAT superfamily N-acetyltransferase
VDRTRSEYRLSGVADIVALTPPLAAGLTIRNVTPDDRQAAAALMLDAYRGSVDDEGEGDDEALAAIDEYFTLILWPHSFVVHQDDELVGMSFVVMVDGRHFIDPVTTASAHKGAGVGRAAVRASLKSLVGDGVSDAGAVITDGNVPSERLFSGLGFIRVGPWV